MESDNNNQNENSLPSNQISKHESPIISKNATIKSQQSFYTNRNIPEQSKQELQNKSNENYEFPQSVKKQSHANFARTDGLTKSMSKVFTQHKEKLLLQAHKAKEFFKSLVSDLKSMKFIRPKYNQHYSKDQFVFDKMIGKGGYSKVYRVEDKSTKIKYACKVSSKTKLIYKGSINHALKERKMLIGIDHEFIGSLRYSFQDKDNLYLLQEYLPGGDLHYHLSKNKRFTEEQTRFFVACIILALEYLHVNGILHRDIKPGNLMFDSDGYLKLIDFGLATYYSPENKSDTSGTPGYMAPEVMYRQNHGVAVDYYAIGVICYECMLNKPPYKGHNRKAILDEIFQKQVQIKKHEIPEGWSLEAADFMNRQIQRRPTNRLGLNGPKEVKNHPWLKSFPFHKLIKREQIPPFKPNMQADNFETDGWALSGVIGMGLHKEVEIDQIENYAYLEQTLNKDAIQTLFASYNFYQKPILEKPETKNVKHLFELENEEDLLKQDSSRYIGGPQQNDWNQSNIPHDMEKNLHKQRNLEKHMSDSVINTNRLGNNQDFPGDESFHKHILAKRKTIIENEKESNKIFGYDRQTFFDSKANQLYLD